MNETIIGWANAGFTQAVAAAVLIGICNWLAKTWRNASDAAKTEMHRKALRWLSRGMDGLQYLFIFGFVWNGLRPLLSPETPPSRLEVFGIAVWSAFAVAGFFMLVMAAFDDQKTMQPAELPPESCSNGVKNPTDEASTSTNTAKTDSEMPRPR